MEINNSKGITQSIGNIFSSSIVFDTSTDPRRSVCYYNNNTTINLTNSLLTNSLILNKDTLVKVSVGLNGTSLDNNCFKDSKLLTSITIGSNVTYIGDDCFNGCTSLIKVTIQSKNIKFGDNCFFGCLNLNNINIPDQTTELSKSCFEGCIRLSNLTLGKSIKILNNFCLANCNQLSTLIIPETVESIGNGCFYGSSALSEFTFKNVNNLQICGKLLFDSKHNSSIVYIKNLSDSSEITSDAFRSFAQQNSRESLDSTIYKYDIRDYLTNPTIVTYNNNTTRNINVENINQTDLIESNLIKSVTISKYVTNIGDNCFKDCTVLNDVLIERTNTNDLLTGFTKIGTSAFASNTSLTNITLPINLLYISNSAFNNCRSLENIVIPDSVTYLGPTAFSRNVKLVSITFGTNNLFDTLNFETFYDCSSLKNIIIPSTIKKIENFVFFNCTNLTYLTIPNSVTFLGNGCFSMCNNLNVSIDLNNSNIETFSTSCFRKCSNITTINIPSKTTSIGSLCFSECTKLNSITFKNANNLTFCGNDIFKDHTMSVTIYLKGITDASKITSEAFKLFAAYTPNYTSLTSQYFIYDTTNSSGGDSNSGGGGSGGDSNSGGGGSGGDSNSGGGGSGGDSNSGGGGSGGDSNSGGGGSGGDSNSGGGGSGGDSNSGGDGSGGDSNSGGDGSGGDSNSGGDGSGGDSNSGGGGSGGDSNSGGSGSGGDSNSGGSGSGGDSSGGSGSGGDSSSTILDPPSEPVNRDDNDIIKDSKINIYNLDYTANNVIYKSGTLVTIPINIKPNITALTIDNDGNLFYALETPVETTYNSNKNTVNVSQIWRIPNNNLTSEGKIFMSYTGIFPVNSFKANTMVSCIIKKIFFGSSSPNANIGNLYALRYEIYDGTTNIGRARKQSDEGYQPITRYNTNPLYPEKDDYNLITNPSIIESKFNLGANNNTPTKSLQDIWCTSKNISESKYYYTLSIQPQGITLRCGHNSLLLNNNIASGLKNLTMSSKMVASSINVDIIYISRYDAKEIIIFDTNVNFSSPNQEKINNPPVINVGKYIDELLIDFSDNLYCIHILDRSITKILKDKTVLLNYYIFPDDSPEITGDNDFWHIDSDENIYRLSNQNLSTLYKIVPSDIYVKP